MAGPAALVQGRLKIPAFRRRPQPARPDTQGMSEKSRNDQDRRRSDRRTPASAGGSPTTSVTDSSAAIIAATSSYDPGPSTSCDTSGAVGGDCGAGF